MPGSSTMPGQHYNHTHFWKWMKPGGGGDKIPGNLEKKIVADLGSVAKMKEDFIQAGVTQLGSGWCRLAVKDGKVAVTKTANGESPLVRRVGTFLLRRLPQTGGRITSRRSSTISSTGTMSRSCSGRQRNKRGDAEAGMAPPYGQEIETAAKTGNFPSFLRLGERPQIVIAKKFVDLRNKLAETPELGQQIEKQISRMPQLSATFPAPVQVPAPTWQKPAPQGPLSVRPGTY